MNNHFTRTKTAAAVSALLTALAMPAANAVEVAGNGLGDSVLSNLYTVRSNQVTNISVVNTSGDYVAAFHIRFRQAPDSVDVRDFNVFLSPNDVWNASLSLNADGTVAIKTVDTSCTAPTLMPKGTANTPANRQLGFVLNGQTVNGLPVRQMDLATSYSATARDGYVEIIELGVALPKSQSNPFASLLASWAVHTTVPPTQVDGITLGQDCTALTQVYTGQKSIAVTGSASNPSDALDFRVACNLDTYYSTGQSATGVDAFRAEFCEPLNVLKASSNIVRVNTGVIFDAAVTTLANFASPGTTVRPLPIHVPPYPARQTPPWEAITAPVPAVTTPVVPGTELYNQPDADDLMAWTPDGSGQPTSALGFFPNLMNGRPGGFYVVGGGTSATSTTVVQDILPAVSQQVFNGLPISATFVAGVPVVGSTIATVSAIDSLITSTAVINEWQSVIANTTPQTGLVLAFPTKWYHNWGCAPASVLYWNREEREVTGLVMPSPGTGSGICGEVNTLSFRLNKNFFAGLNVPPNPNTVYSITGSEPVQQGFTNGWVRLSFDGSFAGSPLVSAEGFTFAGYPVTGFAATSVTNGVTSAYNSAHAYDREIGAPAP